MAPTLFELFGVAVPAYFVFTCLAYATGFGWLHRRARRILVDGDGLVGLYMALFVTGWLGARVMHLVGGAGIVHPLALADALVSSGGGVAFLGGVLGGTLGAVVYMRWAGLPTWKLLDAAAPGLMFGLALGRMGCFFAGCCHGRAVEAAVAWEGLELPGGEVVWLTGPPFLAFVFQDVGYGSIFGVPVYPTQALEVAGATVLGGALAWMTARGRRFDGQVFATMLAGYAALRWLGEGMRGDTVRGTDHALWGGVFSTGELSSVVLCLLAVGIVAVRWQVPVGTEPVAVLSQVPEDGVELDLPEP